MKWYNMRISVFEFKETMTLTGKLLQPFSRNFCMSLVFCKCARNHLVACVQKNIMVSGVKKV